MNRKTAFTCVALACAFAMLSSQTYLFAGAQGTEYFGTRTPTPSSTFNAPPVPIGINTENLYIFYAALAVAIGILIPAATALVIRKVVLEKQYI